MPPQTPQDQLAWNKRLLKVTRGRVCGWLNWAFADTPSSTDLTRWSGLWTDELQLKPWGRAFSQFARGAAHTPAPFNPITTHPVPQAKQRNLVLTDPAAAALASGTE